MIYGARPDSDLWRADHINIGLLVDFLGCHVECVCVRTAAPFTFWSS